MSLTPQIATQRIARSLNDVETEIDRALASGAGLLANVASARVEVGASAATGQLAIMRLSQAIASLTDARKEIVQAHKELRKVGEERADIVWPDECPESGVVSEPTRVTMAA